MTEWQLKLNAFRDSLHAIDEEGSDEQIALHMTAMLRAYQYLAESEKRHHVYFDRSSDGIWQFSFDGTVSTEEPTESQINGIFQHAFLAECNDSFARMYGFTAPEQVKGTRLHVIMNPDEPKNREALREFIRNNYFVLDSESIELDRQGNSKRFLNNVVGRVEDSTLICIWGSQREVPLAGVGPESEGASDPVMELSFVLTDDRLPDDIRRRLSNVESGLKTRLATSG